MLNKHIEIVFYVNMVTLCLRISANSTNYVNIKELGLHIITTKRCKGIMFKKYMPYIVSILISLGIGGLSAFLTKDSMPI